MFSGHFAREAEKRVETELPSDSPDDAFLVYRETLREALQENWAGGYCRMPDAVRCDRTLSPKAKIVYEQLLSYMWFSSDHCWPSQQTLADATGYSRRTVIRACKELYERGYIEKWRRGQGHTNYYFINPLMFPHSFRRTGREPAVSMLLDAHAPELRMDCTGSTPRSIDDTLAQCQCVTSRSDKPAHPEVSERHPNYTKRSHDQEKERSSNTSTSAQKGTVFPVAVVTTRNEQQQASRTEVDAVGERQDNDDASGFVPSKPNTSLSNSPSPHAAAVHAKDVGYNINGFVEAELQNNRQTKRAAIAVATGIPEQHLAEMGIAEAQGQRPIPDFLKDLITRYSHELGDSSRSIRSNITRAAKLYYFALDYIKDAQDDPQGFFSELLYEAKQASYRVNGIRYRSAGNRPNRIPVFFTCLENLFELSDDELAYVRSGEPLQGQLWEAHC